MPEINSGNISGNSRRVAKNTLFLYLRMLVLMFVGLFTSRIVLRELGISDFGIYNVVYGLVMMFTVVSNSVSNAVSRFLTFSLGQEDKSRTHKIFSSSIIIMAGMSLLLILLVETLGIWYVNNRLVIPADRIGSAFWVLQCTALLLVIQLFSIPFSAVIIARERMNAFAWISILEAVLKLSVALLLCFTGCDKLVLYSLLMVFVAIIIRTTYALYCRKHFEEAGGKPEWDSAVLGEMLSFSGWSFLGNGVAVMNTRGMDLLSNSFFGVGVNAARGIAVQVENIVKQFVTNFLLALNPQIIKSWSSGNVGYCHQLVIKGCKFTLLILLMFAVPLCFEGETLLALWLGVVPEHAVVFAALSVFCVVVDMMANSVFQLVQATGKVAMYYVVTSSVNLLSFVGAWMLFAFGYGPESSYWALIFVGLLADALKLVFARRQASLKIGHFVRGVLPGPVIAALSASAVCSIVCILFPAAGVVRMLCNVVLSSLIYCGVAYFLALTPGERIFVKDVVNKWKR